MSARSADRRAAEAETDEADPSVEPRGADLANLYRNEVPQLARYFARRGADDAADLVQESFARIAGLGARFGSVEQPAAYLGRIAANLLRHRARSALARSISKHVAIEDVALAGADPVANLEVRISFADYSVQSRICGRRRARCSWRTVLMARAILRYPSRCGCAISQCLRP